MLESEFTFTIFALCYFFTLVVAILITLRKRLTKFKFMTLILYSLLTAVVIALNIGYGTFVDDTLMPLMEDNYFNPFLIQSSLFYCLLAVLWLWGMIIFKWLNLLINTFNLKRGKPTFEFPKITQRTNPKPLYFVIVAMHLICSVGISLFLSLSPCQLSNSIMGFLVASYMFYLASVIFLVALYCRLRNIQYDLVKFSLFSSLTGALVGGLWVASNVFFYYRSIPVPHFILSIIFALFSVPYALSCVVIPLVFAVWSSLYKGFLAVWTLLNKDFTPK